MHQVEISASITPNLFGPGTGGGIWLWIELDGSRSGGSGDYTGSDCLHHTPIAPSTGAVADRGDVQWTSNGSILTYDRRRGHRGRHAGDDHCSRVGAREHERPLLRVLCPGRRTARHRPNPGRAIGTAGTRATASCRERAVLACGERVDASVAQKLLADAVASGGAGAAQVVAAADQVTQPLLLRRRRRHEGELAGAVEPHPSLRASRRSVLTRSPDRTGVGEDATMSQATLIEASSR